MQILGSVQKVQNLLNRVVEIGQVLLHRALSLLKAGQYFLTGSIFLSVFTVLRNGIQNHKAEGSRVLSTFADLLFSKFIYIVWPVA